MKQRIYRQIFHSRKSAGWRRVRRANRDYYRPPFGQRYSKVLITLITIIFLFGLGWLFLCSNFFSIDKIVVKEKGSDQDWEGGLFIKERVTSQVGEILPKKVFYIFKARNYFLLNKKKIKDELESWPLIQKVEIQKIFPDELKIEIIPYLPQAVFLWQDKHYWLDPQGLIIQELPEIEAEDIVREGRLLLIYDKTDKGLPETSIEPTNQFILDLVNKLAEKTDQLKIISAEIINLPHEIHLITSENWRIYVDSTQDTDEQVDNLVLVISEKIKDRSNLKYIDLRFGSKVYYK